MLVGIITGWLGANLMTTGINLMFVTINTTFGDAELKVANITPTVNSVMADVSGTVNSEYFTCYACCASNKTR
jgi:hypothetical protein